MLSSTLRSSNHPLSRSLYATLEKNSVQTLDEFEEIIGKGIKAKINGKSIKVGSFAYVEENREKSEDLRYSKDRTKTAVHISSDNVYKGCYIFHNEYRFGVSEVFEALSVDKEVIVLSGDNEGERVHLKNMLPKDTLLYFNQKPDNKLEFVKNLQLDGKKVMMVGDGLNDSGALKQSDVGIAISENVNVFSPACDGIMDASEFKNLVTYFNLSRQGISIIKWSFILSLFYNIIGLSFAVTGLLMPVIAAILMPLSSISVVVFTTIATQYVSRSLN